MRIGAPPTKEGQPPSHDCPLLAPPPPPPSPAAPAPPAPAAAPLAAAPHSWPPPAFGPETTAPRAAAPPAPGTPVCEPHKLVIATVVGRSVDDGGGTNMNTVDMYVKKRTCVGVQPTNYTVGIVNSGYSRDLMNWSSSHLALPLRPAALLLQRVLLRRHLYVRCTQEMGAMGWGVRMDSYSEPTRVHAWIHQRVDLQLPV